MSEFAENKVMRREGSGGRDDGRDVLHVDSKQALDVTAHDDDATPECIRACVRVSEGRSTFR